MTNNLQHHGIAGMHWGKRNGPPYPLSSSQKTSEEKKSGASSGGSGGEGGSPSKNTKPQKELSKRAQTKAEDKERDKAIEQKKRDSKNRSILSDEDLKKKINRLESEKKLRELTEEEVEPGKKFVRQVLKDSGKKIMTNAVTGAGLYAIKKIASKKDEELGNAMFNGGPKSKK